MIECVGTDMDIHARLARLVFKIGVSRFKKYRDKCCQIKAAPSNRL
jgi:hypothetical protein